MSRELPRVGGVFIQMEDEMGSLAAVIGASLGGVKAMTATSGPGFSLMQEHLGYAAMTEVPCVIVNVMRGGPSTGMPTRPAQGDLMQARWGTHGDHPIVVARAGLGAGDLFRDDPRLQSRRAVPHAGRRAVRRGGRPSDRVGRRFPRRSRSSSPSANGRAATSAISSPSPRPTISSRRWRVRATACASTSTGLTHTADGFPTQQPELAGRAAQRLLDKIERHRDRDRALRGGADARTPSSSIVAIGIVARAARRAVADLRAEGIKAGLAPADHPVAVPRARHARGGGAGAPRAGRRR